MNIIKSKNLYVIQIDENNKLQKTIVESAIQVLENLPKENSEQESQRMKQNVYEEIINSMPLLEDEMPKNFHKSYDDIDFLQKLLDNVKIQPSIIKSKPTQFWWEK